MTRFGGLFTRHNGITKFRREGSFLLLARVPVRWICRRCQEHLPIAFQAKRETLGRCRAGLPKSLNGDIYQAQTVVTSSMTAARSGLLDVPADIGQDAGNLEQHEQKISKASLPIRERLRRWQSQHEQKQREEEGPDKVSTGATTVWSTTDPTQAAGRTIDFAYDPHAARLDLEEDGDDIDSEEEVTDLAPGDLVEQVYDKQCVLTIYVRRINQQSQFLTSFGSWLQKDNPRTNFVVPGFVRPSELDLILPHLPNKEVGPAQTNLLKSPQAFLPLKVRATLVKKMLSFLLQADETYRLNAKNIDNAYDTMADTDRLFRKHITEIAARVLGWEDGSKIPPPAIWAVHRALKIHQMGFVPDSTRRSQLGLWKILPHRQTAVMKRVQAWLREHQDQAVSQADPNITARRVAQSADVGPSCKSKIVQFAAWARPMIEESRKYREIVSSDGIGPFNLHREPKTQETQQIVPQPISLGVVEEPHRSIIQFIELWAVLGFLRSTDALSALGPMILRATGMYNDLILDRAAGFTFLKEIGFIVPWMHRPMATNPLELPGRESSVLADRLLVDSTRSVQHFQAIDTMEHLRKNWGDLEVFCIDSAGTQEVDDGISLEPGDGDDLTYWIHVHVANPTAFVRPSHPLSRYAEHLHASIYHADSKYAMLPPSLVADHFSLDTGRPTLTFSAKVDADGQVLDTRVTPGRIHNVVFSTYDALMDLLAPDKTKRPPSFAYAVGPNHFQSEAKRPDLTEHFTASQARTLRKLQELGRATAERRRSNIPFEHSTRQFTSSAAFGADVPLSTSTELHRIEGDPTIVHRGQIFEPMVDNVFHEYYAAWRMVPDIMNLACEVAGLWCHQRNLPVIYRGTRDIPTLPPISDYQDNVLRPIIQKMGSVPFIAHLEYARLYGRLLASARPRRHELMEVDAYVQCTSPLRRFGDMVCHWQIEATLLHEASAVTAAPSGQATKLPFSFQQVAEICPRVMDREAAIKGQRRRVQHQWIAELVFRKIYFNEGEPLPEIFTAYISSGRIRNEVKCILRELDHEGFVPQATSSDDPPIGSEWTAKIVRVSLMNYKIYVELLGRVN